MTTRATRARLAWLLLAIVPIVALVASSAVNFVAARGLATTLSLGEAEAHFGALRAASPPGFGPGRAEDFARVVDERAALGLRWLALVDDRGRVVRAGGPVPPEPIAAPPPGRVDRVGAFVRVTAPPPHRQGPPPPHDAERGPPPRLIAELEPRVAERVEQRAAQNLVAAALVSALFVAAALVLRRASRAADAAEAELVAGRHLAQLGEMSAVLAHELRNPLASLKGHAQLLAEELPEGEKPRSRAERIVVEATRLEALTTELLDLSRSGKVQLRDVDPTELLAAAVAEVGDPRIVVDASRAPSVASLDPIWMRQALVNLLRNASQASPEGASIDVEVRVEGGALCFSVRDRGPGLADDELARIFEAFHTTKTRGTGLGLTIARRVVALHGGELRARNHADGGALFEIVGIPCGGERLRSGARWPRS